MELSDVPDSLVELGAQAHEAWYLEHNPDPDREIYWASHQQWVRQTLTAVLPAHAEMVRARRLHVRCARYVCTALEGIASEFRRASWPIRIWMGGLLSYCAVAITVMAVAGAANVLDWLGVIE